MLVAKGMGDAAYSSRLPVLPDANWLQRCAHLRLSRMQTYTANYSEILNLVTWHPDFGQPAKPGGNVG
jgi:hypothetical protein